MSYVLDSLVHIEVLPACSTNNMLVHYFFWKEASPQNLVLAPGASIRINTVHTTHYVQMVRLTRSWWSARLYWTPFINPFIHGSLLCMGCVLANDTRFSSILNFRIHSHLMFSTWSLFIFTKHGIIFDLLLIFETKWRLKTFGNLAGW